MTTINVDPNEGRIFCPTCRWTGLARLDVSSPDVRTTVMVEIMASSLWNLSHVSEPPAVLRVPVAEARKLALAILAVAIDPCAAPLLAARPLDQLRDIRDELHTLANALEWHASGRTDWSKPNA